MEKRKKKVIIDIDGCLRNFDDSFNTMFRYEFPDKIHLIKSTGSWGLHNRYPMTADEVYDYIYVKRGKEIFLENAQPYNYAEDADTMKKFMADEFDHEDESTYGDFDNGVFEVDEGNYDD